MSVTGRNYWHSDSHADLNWLAAVIDLARSNGESIRLLTLDGKLQVKRGGGEWSAPLSGTLDYSRDEMLEWQGPLWPFQVEAETVVEVRECDEEFGPHIHSDIECARMLGVMREGYQPDPMDNIPAGTPDSWIPDNPDENGMRDSDFI